MANAQVLEGTWEELKLHDKELSGKRFRLILLSSEPDTTVSKASKAQQEAVQEPAAKKPRQLTGMGKFAGIIPSSEEFMRRKQEEIELEERKLRG
jgi:hypothetical protein